MSVGCLLRYPVKFAKNLGLIKLGAKGKIGMSFRLPIKNLLVMIIALQLAFTGLIYLDFIGLEIPIFRQAIGFVYLTLVPGILITVILRIYDLNLDVLLYSVGLGFSSIMLAGAFANILLPRIGVTKPMSEVPLTISLNIFFLLLIAVCYLRNKNSAIAFTSDQNPLPWTLFLLLIPFLGIIGSQLLRIYENSYGLLTLFLIISIISLFVAFDKIPKRMYPLAIWVISISLLFQSLASVTSVFETVMPGIVMRMGVWDPLLAFQHSSLLADSILDPTFLIMCDMDIIWGLRFIACFSLSLIPVIIYQVIRKIGSEKIAFMSSLFFVSMYYFFAILPFVTRTGFALLFSALLLLPIVDKEISFKASFLGTIFAFSLIVSHYGVSYISMFSIIAALFLSFLSEKLGYHNERKLFVSLTFASLYIVMALSWYIYTSGGLYFRFIVSFSDHVASELSNLLSPESSHIIESLQIQWSSISIQLIKYFLIIFCFFIWFGISTWLFYLYGRRKKIDCEYLFFAIGFFAALLATVLPIGGLGNMRTILIVILPLSFFCTIGFLEFSNIAKKILKGNSSGKLTDESFLKIFSILIIIFFLLNSGFISETITKDYSPNVLINRKLITESDNIEAKRILYALYYIPTQNIYGVEWLQKYGIEWKNVYCDRIGMDYVAKTTRFGELPESIHRPKPRILNVGENIEKGNYVFLAYHNNLERIAIVESYPLSWFNMSELSLDNINKIYSNGNSIIYYSS